MASGNRNISLGLGGNTRKGSNKSCLVPLPGGHLYYIHMYVMHLLYYIIMLFDMFSN